ncbi:helix-turn-helix domain-containing protein [uncultured Cohaesibacter sp.]|uniref:helix-turn-helix domain-containing protein n=1 Tax=uncultured Cohaesibacter sp. TaxID=1002546 RepID=UPI0029C86642|nr:helix-turn-helix domain-containing protein [uncultured Cohaesibacter sp.]
MIIRKLRLDRGLSQEQLADMAGISTRTLQRIERGAKASPETLKCLAAVLEVEFTDLNKEQIMAEQNSPSQHPHSPSSGQQDAAPSAEISRAPAPAPEASYQAAPTRMPQLSADEQEAMEYVRDIKSFYTHATTYACVMLLLLVINLINSPGYFWVIWPALGWGIGLTIHGFNTFEVINLLGDDWERKQIEKRLKRKRK